MRLIALSALLALASCSPESPLRPVLSSDLPLSTEAPADPEGLAPTVDPRFGRTWRVEGMFGTGTAGLVDFYRHADGSVMLYFLSAAHVTDGNGTEFFLWNEVLDLRLDNASATFVHPTEDAVVLSVSVSPEEALLALPTLMDLRWENLALGEEVLLDGFGAGDRWISEGRVSAPRRVSMTVFFGDSGSPLQDAEGRVCGIVVMRGPANHHCHIVPMAAVREWLEGLSIR